MLFYRALAGSCCLQNSCLLFRKSTVFFMQSTILLSSSRNWHFIFGSFNKPSRYSLSGPSSLSNLAGFLLLTLLQDISPPLSHLALLLLLPDFTLLLVEWPLCFVLHLVEDLEAAVLFGLSRNGNPPPRAFSMAFCALWTPNLKPSCSGLTLKPRWQNIRLCSKSPR